MSGTLNLQGSENAPTGNVKVGAGGKINIAGGDELSIAAGKKLDVENGDVVLADETGKVVLKTAVSNTLSGGGKIVFNSIQGAEELKQGLATESGSSAIEAILTAAAIDENTFQFGGNAASANIADLPAAALEVNSIENGGAADMTFKGYDGGEALLNSYTAIKDNS